jgi:hypothetical protein
LFDGSPGAQTGDNQLLRTILRQVEVGFAHIRQKKARCDVSPVGENRDFKALVHPIAKVSTRVTGRYSSTVTGRPVFACPDAETLTETDSRFFEC